MTETMENSLSWVPRPMRCELEVNDLTVAYRQPGGRVNTAVDSISFKVSAGEVVGLVGESGCGKSTTARAICGLERPKGGSIMFNGKKITPLTLRRRPKEFQSIQMVFQNPYASLNPRRTIRHQIEDGRRANRGEAPSVEELLDLVEIPRSAAGEYPYQFSGGQCQRIAIARAVAAGADLLIGDEPIASLDASLQAKIAQLMRDVCLKTGASLLFISHDLAVVRLIADRVIVMQSGHIVEQGPTEEIWQHPKEAYTQRLLAAIPEADGLGHIPQV
ncbi:ABC transporter ATP-binding protein [Bifidobacterium simiarum]|uniref:ABC transporter ATP-binding protein n=1 Tax=Bifidobacterium simiarum TaxID=2045441 RepID=UPI001BDD16A0|nr:ATP-binding cassette domain-containing protein [Bifidobacterium simiarum]MBT1166104.1 ABC transporter ATP-binding protein [Bifidobacterium simiarum]